MKLNLKLIEDELDCLVKSSNYHDDGLSLNLSSWEYLESQPSTNSRGVLFIVPKNVPLQSNLILTDCAFILIGDKTSIQLSKTNQYLVLAESTNIAHLINQINNIFLKYLNMEQGFQKLLYSEAPLESLVKYMYGYMGNEIVILDKNHSFLAHSHEQIVVNSLSGLKQENPNKVPLEVIHYFKNDPLYAQVTNYKKSFFYTSSILARDCWCFNIFKNDSFYMRIVVNETDHPFRPYDPSILDCFGTNIQDFFNHGRFAYIQTSMQKISALCIQILNDMPVETEEILSAMTLEQWKKEDPLACICITMSESDQKNNITEAYCNVLMNRYKGTCAFSYQENILFIVNLREYNYDLQEFISEFALFVRDASYYAGCSNPFENVRNLPYAFKQAKAASELGKKNNPQIWIHHFKDYVIQYISNGLCSRLPAEFLCSPALETLRTYDGDNNMELFSTLKVYLDNQCNAQKTAADLYIHRGTMNYRLKRIKEITGLSLTDPDELLYLSISYRIQN